MTHGTHSGYASGCRCPECREAHRVENNVYYHNHTPGILAQQAEYRRLHPRICKSCPFPADKKSPFCAGCREARKIAERKRRKLKARKDRKNPAYREQQRLAAVAYRERYPERIKEGNRRAKALQPHLRLYGTSVEKVKAMASQQDGRCAICGRQEELHVDHDHTTGRVRALLCGKCNRGLGMFDDSTQRLAQAIIYLSRFIQADQLNFNLEDLA